MHPKKITIKSQVYNYYFDNSVKVKKFETKNILINQKHYKNLVVRLLDMFILSR